MRSLGILIGLLLGFSLLAGTPACGKKEVKPTADMLKAREVREAVERLEKAYVERDPARFLQGIAPNFPERDILERAVRRAATAYDRIELHLTITLIRLAEDQAHVSVQWDGRWREAGTGKEALEKGGVVLTLQGADLRVTKIEGESPFTPFLPGSPRL
ncbi:MAG: nuclear transport factor 2 family protein [Nitrospirae bacterium]|nr:nuclear transport factor 2 family protein [Nitrospirota bacterium]